MALSEAIYSQIALSFALNRISFSANENGIVQQNNQSDFKAFKTNQSHCRKMKDNNIGTDQNLVVLVFKAAGPALADFLSADKNPRLSASVR